LVLLWLHVYKITFFHAEMELFLRKNFISYVTTAVNLPLHHKVQKFFSGTGSPGWSQIKGRKMVVVVVVTGPKQKGVNL